MAQALAGTGARILVIERGEFVPAEEQNWSPEAVWQRPALPHDRALARRARRVVRAVHALRHRRQHEVLGQRAVPAAPRGLPGGRARRRGVAGLAHRLRDARALLRAGRAALPRARRGRRRPDGAAARAVSACAPSRTPAAWRCIVEQLRAQGLHPVAAAAGAAEPGRAGRLHPVQHLQFVSVQAAGEKRRRGLRHARARWRIRTSRCGPAPWPSAW